MKTSTKIFALVALGFVTLGLLASPGCAGAPSKDDTLARLQDGLGESKTLVDKAADAVATWAKGRLAVIVDTAKSEAEGNAAVAAHEAFMVKVDKAVAVTYATLRTAAAALAVVEATKGKAGWIEAGLAIKDAYLAAVELSALARSF